MRQPTPRFVLVAFGWSWPLLSLLVLDNRDVVSLADWASGAAGGLAVIGPGVAALALASDRGRRPSRALAEALRGWRRPARWYAVAGLGPIGMLVAASALVLATGRPLPTPALEPGLLLASSVLAVEGFGEELGWRGHLLPLLLERHGPVRATLLVGGTWWAWHLPLFLTTGNVINEVPLAVYFVMIVTGSFAFTWVHLRTASVVLAAVMHAMVNIVATPFLIRAAPGDVPTMFGALAVVTAAVALCLLGTGALDREPALAG